MEIAAGEQISLEADLISGKRTEEIGGLPGRRKLRHGDLVTADIVLKIGGYWGDTTRTFSTGEFSKRQKEIYKIVMEALEKGIGVIKAGVRTCDVDKTIRNFIKETGYGEYFDHHTGHRIGLTHFEAPFISYSPAYEDSLDKAGRVLCTFSVKLVGC